MRARKTRKACEVVWNERVTKRENEETVIEENEESNESSGLGDAEIDGARSAGADHSGGVAWARSRIDCGCPAGEVF